LRTHLAVGVPFVGNNEPVSLRGVRSVGRGGRPCPRSSSAARGRSANPCSQPGRMSRTPARHRRGPGARRPTGAPS